MIFRLSRYIGLLVLTDDVIFAGLEGLESIISVKYNQHLRACSVVYQYIEHRLSVDR